MKTSKFIIPASLLSFIGTIFVYRFLPPEIPIHWGIDGNIDRYGPRYVSFLTALLPIALYGLFLVIPKLDPRRDSYEKHRDAYGVIIFTLIVFLIGLHWVVIFYSLGNHINITMWIKLCIGLLFVIIGNFLPVIKPNYTLGIRTPWTLANERVWEKTHRFGGYAFVITGLLWLLMAFLNGPWVFYFLIGFLLLAVLSLFVYSYRIFPKDRP